MAETIEGAPPPDSCGTCRFFLLRPEMVQPPGGFCRRYPPSSIFDNQGEIQWRWTRTQADYWCGEWAFIPGPPQVESP